METQAPSLPLLRRLTHVGLHSLWAKALMLYLFIAGMVAMAGAHGLQGLMEPLLRDQRFNSLLLMGWGLYVVGRLLQGTFQTARNGELLGTQWSQWHTPFAVALIAGCWIPTHTGMSPAMQGLVACLRWGAGL